MNFANQNRVEVYDERDWDDLSDIYDEDMLKIRDEEIDYKGCSDITKEDCKISEDE